MLNITAAKTIGVESKNEYFAALSLSSFKALATVIVIPDLEVPGKAAAIACEIPIKNDCLNVIFSKFTFDTNRENQAKNTLENILNKKYKGINMTITGGSTMVAFSENHGVGYKYEYATIGNKTFKNLNTELENIRTNFKNEFKGIFNEAIYVVYPGYGVYPYYDKLLTDEVCGQFNLVCDRW